MPLCVCTIHAAIIGERRRRAAAEILGNAVLAYDIGMHNGDDTAYYRAKGFRVVSVEAMPDFATSARKRFDADIKSGDVVIENVGIADTSGELSFYINPKNTVQSSFVAPTKPGWIEIKIPTTTLPEIVRRHGAPDFMKIDIEHFDLHALKSLAEANIIPRYISSEAHSIDILLQLWAMGYRRFRLLNCRLVSKLFAEVEIKTLSGKHVRHAFPEHSSGPYGDDIRFMPWMGIEGAMALWLNRAHILGAGWYDVHAAMPGGGDDMYMG
ncbi:MAG: FkbM family methyltransferase [Terricaulis sp.]